MAKTIFYMGSTNRDYAPATIDKFKEKYSTEISKYEANISNGNLLSRYNCDLMIILDTFNVDFTFNELLWMREPSKWLNGQTAYIGRVLYMDGVEQSSVFPESIPSSLLDNNQQFEKISITYSKTFNDETKTEYEESFIFWAYFVHEEYTYKVPFVEYYNITYSNIKGMKTLSSYDLSGNAVFVENNGIKYYLTDYIDSTGSASDSHSCPSLFDRWNPMFLKNSSNITDDNFSSTIEMIGTGIQTPDNLKNVQMKLISVPRLKNGTYKIYFKSNNKEYTKISIEEPSE